MAYLRCGGFIYGLKNPITDEVYYVGQTISTLKDRLRQHIWESKHKNYGRCLVTKQIIEIGLLPIIFQLENVQSNSFITVEKELTNAEIKWISKYDNLTNINLNRKKMKKNEKMSKLL